MKRGVAQLASVLAWGASGRPFESDHPDKDRMRVCDNADPLRFYPCANNLQTHIFIQYSEILLLTTRIEIKNPRS